MTNRAKYPHPPKYPRTPYWPNSPSEPHQALTMHDPSLLINRPVVITEKVDGSNTLIHRGQVYSKSTSAQGPAPWQGLVKKHHAWKLANLPWLIYGENIQAVHSIEYAPVSEENSFMAFALASPNGVFAPYPKFERICQELDIPTVPVLYRGTFQSYEQLDEWIQEQHKRPSKLGGELEGMVIRAKAGFHRKFFELYICKSVRPNHVQTEQHWSQGWKQCQLLS